jgi:hypothetical protein
MAVKAAAGMLLVAFAASAIGPSGPNIKEPDVTEEHSDFLFLF